MLEYLDDRLRPYLVNICQFFGFGFTFPLGKFLIEWTFDNEAPSFGRLVLSSVSFILAVVALIIGGIITTGRPKI